MFVPLFPGITFAQQESGAASRKWAREPPIVLRRCDNGSIPRSRLPTSASASRRSCITALAVVQWLVLWRASPSILI